MHDGATLGAIVEALYADVRGKVRQGWPGHPLAPSPAPTVILHLRLLEGLAQSGPPPAWVSARCTGPTGPHRAG